MKIQDFFTLASPAQILEMNYYFFREQTTKLFFELLTQKSLCFVLLSQLLSCLNIEYEISYFMFFEQLIVMILYLEKPYHHYIFTKIIPTFSILFPNFYQYFFVEGHVKALSITFYYEFCTKKPFYDYS